jgi:glutathione S-transferase
MLTLYGNLESGNVHKVRLLLSHLGLAHRRVDVDQRRGEPMSGGFRAVNPIGKVPALGFDDGRVLTESGVILYYLAQGEAYWPAAAWDRAEVLRWMFFEQYSHEPAIAVNRYLIRFAGNPPGEAARIAANAERGAHALAVMDGHLGRHDWLAAGCYTIADMALYPYTEVAGEGGFDLAAYPAVGRWLARVRAQPGHLPMYEESAAGPVTRLEATT